LNVALAILGCNPAEGAAGRVDVDVIQVRVVRQVEEFAAKRNLLALGDGEVLEHAEVPVLGPGIAHELVAILRLRERTGCRNRPDRAAGALVGLEKELVVIPRAFREAALALRQVRVLRNIPRLEARLANARVVDLASDGLGSAGLELDHTGDGPAAQ